MANRHLKRLAAPKAWQIKRKSTSFIAKPVPGPHSLEAGMPLNIVLKETLGYASTNREVKKMIASNEVKIDGKIRMDSRFPVGIFDTLEFTGIGEHYRVTLNRQGKLDLVKTDKADAAHKPCKIIGKTAVRGKLQLNLYDGKNMLVDKDDYAVGDSVVVSLPDNKITKHLKLDKKSTIFLIGGKHIGEIGHVEDVARNKIIYKDEKNELIETSKEYAFVIGDSKPFIHLK